MNLGIYAKFGIIRSLMLFFLDNSINYESILCIHSFPACKNLAGLCISFFLFLLHT